MPSVVPAHDSQSVWTEQGSAGGAVVGPAVVDGPTVVVGQVPLGPIYTIGGSKRGETKGAIVKLVNQPNRNHKKKKKKKKKK